MYHSRGKCKLNDFKVVTTKQKCSGVAKMEHNGRNAPKMPKFISAINLKHNISNKYNKLSSDILMINIPPSNIFETR